MENAPLEDETKIRRLSGGGLVPEVNYIAAIAGQVDLGQSSVGWEGQKGKGTGGCLIYGNGHVTYLPNSSFMS